MNEATIGRNASQYVTIGLDREVFAFDVAHVREILDHQTVSRVPNAPVFMAGLIDVRGAGIPVIDLRSKLGLPPVPVTENTRIVVLDVAVGNRQITMGMIADRVIEVTSLGERSLESPPDLGVRWRSDYIQAIGRRGDDFVIVFDLARLFTTEEAALVSGQPTADSEAD